MRRLLRRLRRAGEILLQSFARGLLRAAMRCRLRAWRSEQLARSAVVFAPHQDDEVLGCGGTIARKRQAGADVTVVFMTDGSASHPELMPGDEMKRLRAAEALAACRLLGVPGEQVLFLELKDGEMGQHLDKAVPQVLEILRRLQPAEVFIPHYHDGSPDHLATTRAVLSALRAHDQATTVYEYPVWLWCHWPWISLPGKLSEIPATLRHSAEANWRLWRDCRSFVQIGDLLDLKRAALEEHKSQLRSLVPGSKGFYLGDVSGGEFLACFFHKREIFYQHRPSDPNPSLPIPQR